MTTVGVSVRRASASALAIAAAIAVIVSTAGVPALAGDASSSEAVGSLYEETGSSSSTSGDTAAEKSAAGAETAASEPSDESTDTGPIPEYPDKAFR